MARPAAPTNPPCPRCAGAATVANGHVRGRPRWRCSGCQRSFGPSTGTVMARLKTPAAEVAQALLVVLRRGSLRAAEEVTGHKYETISRWLRRAAAHADSLTDALVHDLHLSEVEVDEFWSFVHHKGGQPPRTTAMGRTVESGGGA
jgi:transposase-like protein